MSMRSPCFCDHSAIVRDLPFGCPLPSYCPSAVGYTTSLRKNKSCRISTLQLWSRSSVSNCRSRPGCWVCLTFAVSRVMAAIRSFIVWLKDTGKLCVHLMNPRRTWTTARAGDALMVTHNGTKNREHIESVQLYRVFPADQNG